MNIFHGTIDRISVRQLVPITPSRVSQSRRFCKVPLSESPFWDRWSALPRHVSVPFWPGQGLFWISSTIAAAGKQTPVPCSLVPETLVGKRTVSVFLQRPGLDCPVVVAQISGPGAEARHGLACTVWTSQQSQTKTFAQAFNVNV